MAEFRNNRSQGKDDVTDIMELIVSNKATLVVGSEAMLKRDMSGTQGTGDSMFLVYNTIADIITDIPSDPDMRPQTDHEWQLLLAEFSLNNFGQCKFAWDKIEKRYGYLQDYIDPSLKGLLETKAFKVVITTTITPELENLMRSIWGDEFQVFDFSNPDDILLFQKMWDRSEKEKLSPLQPSLIYLYHPLSRGGTSPFSEDDFISAIDEFRQQSYTGSASNLFFQNFLFKRHLVAVGCHYDDWRFRFFWYALRNNNSNLRNGTIVYTTTDNDKSLNCYLKCTPSYTVKFDSREFMNNLKEVLVSKENWEKLFLHRVADAKGVFISYAKEDFCLAWDLYKFLQNKGGLNVWIDREELHAGESYESDIENNIKKCGIFLPLLSSQTKKDMTKGNYGRYYFKEWEMAVSNARKIVPVVAGNYNLDDSYHMEFRKRCLFADVKNDVHIEHINNMSRISDQLKKILFE